MALAWIGLLGGLALRIVLTMRGVDLLIAASHSHCTTRSSNRRSSALLAVVPLAGLLLALLLFSL
jgi:hypothetical protein